MTKGRRYAIIDQGGKWFAHIGSPQNEVTREAATTTGAMLSQAIPEHMQEQEKYPKSFINPEKKTMSRKYPISEHDNRTSLQDNIDTYGQCVGRKKCLDDRRQHDSHFCLCHDDGTPGVSANHSIYQTDYLSKQNAEGTEDIQHKRRFPKSHLKRSQQAAVDQSEEGYMWFGRHDMNQRIPLNVLAATNHFPA